ncbi:MAG TPA: prolipoprotein diacylglyceryl transferase [Phycisphaerales bacterium]|nr:prolipoprotein diacylglyceryl transferase [Phycisphaerales bacterium]
MIMPALGAWVHTLDPYIVRFGGGYGVRWYGTAYLTGFLLGYLLLRWLTRRGVVLIAPGRVGDAMMWFIGGVLVGGRLGYVLVYQRELLWSFSEGFPWWGLLAINQGGMASHGGIVGVILASWRVSRGWREPGDARPPAPVPFLHITDAVAFLAPIGLTLGRVANFINGELLGRIVAPPGQPAPWWSVRFPHELSGWVSRTERPRGHTPELTPAQERLLWSLVDRAGDVDALIRRADEFAPELARILSARHPSQLYQAFAEGPVLGLILWVAWARPRKAGLIGCLFVLFYGILRIVTEQFRLPDPQFLEGTLGEDPDGRFAGLTMGQWLSVVMVVVGVIALPAVLGRPGPRLGGWLRPAGRPPSTP